MIEGTPCPVCGRFFTPFSRDAPITVCRACERAIPCSLLKATYDSFDYVVRLRSGEVIRFTEARLTGEWVTLDGLKDAEASGFPFSFERGLEVRLADIRWCADAPEGS